MIEVRPTPGALERYYRDGSWRRETIAELIARQVARHPGKLAIKDSAGNSLSYRELEEKAARLSAFLKLGNVGHGDVVTVQLPNCCEIAIVVYAAYKLGAVIHPVPITYGRHDLEYGLRKCNSKAVVIAGCFRNVDHTEMLQRIIREGGLDPLTVVVGQGSANVGISFEDALDTLPLEKGAPCSSDDPAVVLFTSGTESNPKGVVHTHNTILFGERALAERLGLTCDDVCFMASPLTHTTGYTHGLILNLTTGAMLTVLDRFSGARAVEIMDADRATWTMGATVFLGDTVAVLEEKGRRLPQLRYFLCGGAPIPEGVVRRAQSAGVRVLPIYGSTESSPHTLMPPEAPLAASWEWDGQTLPGIEVKIVDGQGKSLPPGAPGEECSRGPNVFLGYLGEPGLTARTIDEEGWYHSGDLALHDGNGAVRIIGRLKDVIIRGGQNISVREIEDLLASHPDLHEAAIVGIPDDRLGELVAAALVMKPGVPPLGVEGIAGFLLERGTTKFKLPQRVAVVGELPRTPSGKIQKYLIRKKFSEVARDEVSYPGM